MPEVVVVAHAHAAEGRVDDVVAAFTVAIEQTHREEGCLAYALHRDSADPHHIVLVERWRSQEDVGEHMTMPYIADLFAAADTPGLLTEPPQLFFLDPLEIGQPAKATLAGAGAQQQV